MPNRREFIVATATHLPEQQATMYTNVDYICASIENEAISIYDRKRNSLFSNVCVIGEVLGEGKREYRVDVSKISYDLNNISEEGACV